LKELIKKKPKIPINFLVFIGILILIMSILLLSVYSSIVAHEQAHVKINDYFGMDSSYKINIGFDGISGVTTNDLNDDYYSPEDRRAAYMVHGINEAIGYQLTPWFTGITGLLVIITFLLIMIMIGGFNNGNGNNRRENIERQRSDSGGLEQPMP